MKKNGVKTLYKQLLFTLILGTLITPPILAKTSQTKINSFKPTMRQGTTKQGYCWTKAIATNRDDAWRCMSSNNIFDPCFTIPSTKNSVVCNIDPESTSQGFILKLTNPLPTITRSKNSAPAPFFIRLENDDICKPFTGTMPILHNGKKTIALQYGCINNAGDTSTGLVENSVVKGKVWRAKQAIYSINNKEHRLAKLQDVVIKEVWQ